MSFLNKIAGRLYPLVEWISSLHLPFTRKRITGVEYYKARDQIEVGDLILTNTWGEFSNIINPSAIKHGGIYIGKMNKNDQVHWVVEATRKGVHLTDLVSYLTSKDCLFVLRKKETHLVEREIAKKYALSKIGLSYDGEFSVDDSKYYCFELLAKAWQKANTNYLAKAKYILGSKIYTSDTFLKDKDNWEIIVNY